MMQCFRKRLTLVLPLLAGLCFGSVAFGGAAAPLAPPTVGTGCFVDRYQSNTTQNLTPEANPSIALLNGFTQLWKPGSSWDNGTKIQSAILDENIQKSIDITTRRQANQTAKVYLDDRRNQSYTMIEGLGPLADDYRTKAGAVTTLTEVAPDATVKKYDDQGNGAGDPKSALGSMVQLVDTVRGKYSSSNPAKYYFQYPRPYRWSDKVVLLPELTPNKSTQPEKDGGFPSGHTNAAYLAALALAYSTPQRYQELLTAASELGYDRILAGMHSTLDVMGGRILGTALAAAILNDPQNQELKLAALQQAGTLVANPAAKDPYANYAENKKNYHDRLTGGFAPVAATNKPMTVPKGAEVLLETRLPYLDPLQRRWVLYTTALPSGYPLMDDAEGWGRLDLFAAADGYGAFLQDVTVTMDATRGGFQARDRWRNDISGSGKLIKKGSGALELAGNNRYTGGTRIDAGSLEAFSATALGNGGLLIKGGTLVNRVTEPLKVEGNYVQNATTALQLPLGAKCGSIAVKGAAKLDGKLILNFTGSELPKETVTLLTCAKRQGQFSSVITQGLPEAYQVKVIYGAKQVRVTVVAR